MKKTLFLSPPSFDGFDGGAGARYQAKREITSFWYPTWLAQPAALVPGSKLVDAPPHEQTLEDVLNIAKDYELAILYTSSPTLANDVKCAAAIKAQNPETQVGLVGPHVAVLSEKTLQDFPVLDFVCRNEFDFTCKELAEGKPYEQINGLSYRDKFSNIQHNPERELIHDWDAMPSVFPQYAEHLDIRKYVIGYLLNPYISLYTGRGCPAQCTFCLWPQTIGGHQYRAKSPEAVGKEMALGKSLFGSGIREYFFDDDTFTIDKHRAIAISEHLKRLQLTWSCNARATLDYDTLKTLKQNGLRLLLVGFESGNQQVLDGIKKGVKLETARRFMKDCNKLGIKVHGAFIIGLPNESQETIEETINFACEVSPHSIQVSIAAPYPGTELYRQAQENGWFANRDLVANSGIQLSSLQYPNLSAAEIEDAVEQMYRRFYFRPRTIIPIVKEMLGDPQLLVRRLREGKEFLSYLRERHTRKSEILAS